MYCVECVSALPEPLFEHVSVSKFFHMANNTNFNLSVDLFSLSHSQMDTLNLLKEILITNKFSGLPTFFGNPPMMIQLLLTCFGYGFRAPMLEVQDF